MNLQQVVPPRSSANGFGRRRDTGNRSDNKSQAGKSNSSRLSAPGIITGNKGGGGYESPSRERLVYLTTCLIGHHVEVQVIDGSVFSGIFHATNAERDFGIILKMARLTKPGSSRGQKNISESVSNTPSKTLIIPARELVQLTAKDVSVTRDGSDEIQREKHQEIMIDSSISQSYQTDAERELERWVPDEDNPVCPELENIFDDPWNRGWDQFEANETLFGVKSTFNEELYTTKLDRGPQTRDLEREALRIAREIEGEDTKDIHLAEERGIQLHGSLELDEETRYSSVLRGVDDSGYDETEDALLDSHNMETFGGISDSLISKSFTNLSTGKSNNGAQLASSSLFRDEIQASQSNASRNLSGSNDHAKLLPPELLSRNVSAFGGESSIQGNHSIEQHGGSDSQQNVKKQMLNEDAQTSKNADSESSLGSKKENFDKGGLSPNATAYAPSGGVSYKGQEKPSSSSELSFDMAGSIKTQGVVQSVNPRARPDSSTSSTSDTGNAAALASNGPAAGLSRSSSIGSLTSEKSSTLNPHAKEFKLNPNAKSFVPTKTSLRPASPVADASFYYPPNLQQLHNMPLGIGGIGPSFPAHQTVMFNPQAAHMQSPQPYFYPNGPQYGQQVMLGQSRPVVYMPNHPAEMQYKGREF